VCAPTSGQPLFLAVPGEPIRFGVVGGAWLCEPELLRAKAGAGKFVALELNFSGKGIVSFTEGEIVYIPAAVGTGVVPNGLVNPGQDFLLKLENTVLSPLKTIAPAGIVD
jgi:hypothetical protein